MILEMARAWAMLPEKPRRSAIFLAVTAEEAGLRGSEYYGQHPRDSRGKNRGRPEFRYVHAVRPRQRRGAERRGANHLLSDRGRSRAPFRSARSSPIRGRRPGPITGPIIFLSRAWAFRRFRSKAARTCSASRREPARSCSTISRSIITISPRTNITTIGIFQGWKQYRALRIPDRRERGERSEACRRGARAMNFWPHAWLAG